MAHVYILKVKGESNNYTVKAKKNRPILNFFECKILDISHQNIATQVNNGSNQREITWFSSGIK